LAREPNWKPIADLWDDAEGAYASLLTYVETRAALAALRRRSARARAPVARARQELERRWEDVDVVEFDALLADVAGLASEKYALRGADAVHLASAATLGSGVALVTLDAALRRAALAAGLDVAP
jgi:uncharacterized protein